MTDTSPEAAVSIYISEVLRHLDQDEDAEFRDGVIKHLYRIEVDRSAETVDALLSYVRSWVVSITLREDPEWQRQVLASPPAPPDERPVDVGALRDMLGIS